MKVLALEGAPDGVTATAVCPGYVRTPLVENQIADQAKAHGMEEDRVLEDVILAPHAVKRLVGAGGGGRRGRVAAVAGRADRDRRAAGDGSGVVGPLAPRRDADGPPREGRAVGPPSNETAHPRRGGPSRNFRGLGATP